jgi:branched-chain amino acid transport system permease protein
MATGTALGGMRGFWGPALGTAALVLLQELALRATLAHGLVLGLLLVAMVFLCPDGIAAAEPAARRWLLARKPG